MLYIILVSFSILFLYLLYIYLRIRKLRSNPDLLLGYIFKKDGSTQVKLLTLDKKNMIASSKGNSYLVDLNKIYLTRHSWIFSLDTTDKLPSVLKDFLQCTIGMLSYGPNSPLPLDLSNKEWENIRKDLEGGIKEVEDESKS